MFEVACAHRKSLRNILLRVHFAIILLSSIVRIRLVGGWYKATVIKWKRQTEEIRARTTLYECPPTRECPPPKTTTAGATLFLTSPGGWFIFSPLPSTCEFPPRWRWSIYFFTNYLVGRPAGRSQKTHAFIRDNAVISCQSLLCSWCCFTLGKESDGSCCIC